MSLCAVCGAQAEVARGGRALCLLHARVDGGTRNKEQGTRKQQARRAVDVAPSLVPGGDSLVPAGESERPEVEQLLALCREGKIEPVSVPLRSLPEDAPALALAVASFIELVYGLRLAAGEDRPLPLAARWVGSKVGIPKSSAHRALRILEAAGVLDRRGSLPGQGKRGTALYAPVPARSGVEIVPLRKAP